MCRLNTITKGKRGEGALKPLQPKSSEGKPQLPRVFPGKGFMMNVEMIRHEAGSAVSFTLDYKDESRKSLKILQLTDTQTIDLIAVRNDTRDSQIRGCYFPDGNCSMEDLCYRHIREAVRRTEPDLILLTGDNVYGEFDDKGTMLLELRALMDSFRIPWAAIFGNHDNESMRGVRWQQKVLEESEYGLFAPGNVTGNCNYSILLRLNGSAEYLIYMMDSCGCRYIGNPGAPGEGLLKENPDYALITQQEGIFPDQIEWYADSAKRVFAAEGKRIPQIACMHIAPHIFRTAYLEKYHADASDFGISLETVQGRDNGYVVEAGPYLPDPDDSFFRTAKELGLRAILVGHDHNNASCVYYEGVALVFGTKTGYVTYPPRPRQVGGTLLTLQAGSGETEVTPIITG